jgi:hypothetical protein
MPHQINEYIDSDENAFKFLNTEVSFRAICAQHTAGSNPGFKGYRPCDYLLIFSY